MDAAEVVVHEVKGNGVFVVFDLLTESVGQAGKTMPGYSNGE